MGTAIKTITGGIFLILLISFPGFLHGFTSPSGPAIPPVSGNLYPLYISSPQVVPHPAQLPGPGELALSSSISYGNSFIVEELRSDRSTINLELDSEAWFFRQRVTMGITEKVALGGELQVAGQWGGFLDPLISGFHHLFGFPDGGREIREYNRSSFIIYQGDERVMDLQGTIGPALFLVVEPGLALYQGADSALSLTLWMGIPILPVQEEFRSIAGTEGFAVAPRLLGAATWGSFSFQGGAGTLFQDGNISILGDFSSAWDTGTIVTPVIGISGRSSPYRFGYERSDLFSATVNIGTFISPPGLGLFQITFTEEFFTFAAADIGFHIGWCGLLP